MARVSRVYVDSCVFLNVIKRERHLWKSSLKVLLASERGDIQLVASTLTLAEVTGFKGDLDPTTQDDVVQRYLENASVTWADVEMFIVRKARQLAQSYRLRGADAVHLATAVRCRADYFMSRDSRFPYGSIIEDITRVCTPAVVWNPTIDDADIDAQDEEPDPPVPQKKIQRKELKRRGDDPPQKP